MSQLKRFKELDSILALNDALREFIQKEYEKNLEYLTILNRLVSELIRGNCNGLGIKIKQTPADPNSFKSMISELEFARYFLRKQFFVTLLPEDFMGYRKPDNRRKSPDMSLKRGLEAYVEVKRLIEDVSWSMILECLREVLSDKDLTLRIDVKLEDALSKIPVKRERGQKKKRVIENLEEFKKKFKKVDLSKIPIKIKTKDATFEIEDSGIGIGYPGLILSKVKKVPVEKLEKKLKEDLLKRAEKREDWKDSHLNKLYLIALDFEEFTLGKDNLEKVLFGRISNNEKSSGKDLISVPQKVEGVRSEWYPLLKDKALIPNPARYVKPEDRGIYFHEKMKNVSGVVGRFPNNFYHFCPNPFAEEKINNSNLQRIF